MIGMRQKFPKLKLMMGRQIQGKIFNKSIGKCTLIEINKTRKRTDPFLLWSPKFSKDRQMNKGKERKKKDKGNERQSQQDNDNKRKKDNSRYRDKDKENKD